MDGVYDKDPALHDDAVKYTRVSYDEALARHLKVMDSTAIALAQDNNVPIIVCSMFGGHIRRAVCGEDVGTTVCARA